MVSLRNFKGSKSKIAQSISKKNILAFTENKTENKKRFAQIQNYRILNIQECLIEMEPLKGEVHASFQNRKVASDA